ncbi:GNAT family N-acetyltransferase [Streptomyces sp. NPDC051211]|uniref:GNAT family N-acetyltransferase n=1 Tax=Streptomyces sp. NPDC051211 TaxID=3154643 RepID=UPI00344E0ABC
MTDVVDGDYMPVLRGERLLLEAYRPEDEEEFVALFQNPLVSRWISDGTDTEENDRALFGRIFSKVYAERLFDVWAVRREAGGPLIGHAEIKRTDQVAGYELVYALAPECWGSGLGTELAEMILTHGFGTLGLPEVYATVAAPNEGSLVLLDRLGFTWVRDIEEEDGSTTRVLVLPRCAPEPSPKRRRRSVS